MGETGYALEAHGLENNILQCIATLPDGIASVYLIVDRDCYIIYRGDGRTTKEIEIKPGSHICFLAKDKAGKVPLTETIAVTCGRKRSIPYSVKRSGALWRWEIRSPERLAAGDLSLKIGEIAVPLPEIAGGTPFHFLTTHETPQLDLSERKKQTLVFKREK